MHCWWFWECVSLLQSLLKTGALVATVQKATPVIRAMLTCPKDKDVSKSRSIWQVGFGIFILPFNMSICINDMYWFPKTPWSMTMEMKKMDMGFIIHIHYFYRYITRKCIHDFSGIVRTHQDSTAFWLLNSSSVLPWVFFWWHGQSNDVPKVRFPPKKNSPSPGLSLGPSITGNSMKAVICNGVRFWNNQVLKKSSGYILLHTHYFGMLGPTRVMITKVKDVDGFGRNSITITHESERNINKDNKGWYKYTDIYI